MADQRYLSRSEAAKYLGMATRTFAREVVPRVPRYCPNGSHPRYRREDLDVFMQGGVELPPQAAAPQAKRAKGRKSVDKAVASNALASSLLRKLEKPRAA